MLGWLGAILFAACGIPQAVKCVTDGHSEGLSWAFLLMWLGGEILTIVYVWPKSDWPLIFNYLFNLVCLAIMLVYKLKPRSKKWQN